MKVGELIEDYQLSWPDIDSFIQGAIPVVLKPLNTQEGRTSWFDGYYRPKKHKTKQYFLVYGATILLGIRCQIKDNQKIILVEALLNGHYKIERSEVVKLIESAVTLANFQTLVIRDSDCDDSWRYCLKQLGANVLKEGFVISPSYHSGLVLGGGGAKGAYQIGAWQAFNEVNWQFSVITGTSVGALNGALIMQGDVDAAKEMWQEIATDKLFDFPIDMEETTYQADQLIGNIQAFVKAALLNKGVNTEPLKQMIEKLLIPKKIKQNSADFYLCTTRLKLMSEQVISVKEQPDELVPLWLLASSSFFPAMSTTKVEGDDYIDGGYRNNIPIDVALAHGATSIVVIDIVGPGVTKTHTVTLQIPVRLLRSHWSLGTVLLFDHERSKWNIKLGYLETKKLLGELSGKRYSFNYESKQQPLRTINYHLLRRIFSEQQIKNTSMEEINAIIKKLRKLINDRVSIHTWLFDLFEQLGKILGLCPVQVYTYESFISALVARYEQLQNEKKTDNAEMLLSIGEYWQSYFGNTPLISEHAQLLLLTDFMLQNKLSADMYKKIALINAPVVMMAQMLATFIKESRNEDGSRI